MKYTYIKKNEKICFCLRELRAAATITDFNHPHRGHAGTLLCGCYSIPCRWIMIIMKIWEITACYEGLKTFQAIVKNRSLGIHFQIIG